MFGPIQGLGPISIDRSRRADNFGGGISFLDVLYVDFEDIYNCIMKIVFCWVTWGGFQASGPI